MANLNDNIVKLIQSANILEQVQQNDKCQVQKKLVFSKKAVREWTHCNVIMRFRHKIQILLNQNAHHEEDSLACN